MIFCYATVSSILAPIISEVISRNSSLNYPQILTCKPVNSRKFAENARIPRDLLLPLSPLTSNDTCRTWRLRCGGRDYRGWFGMVLGAGEGNTKGWGVVMWLEQICDVLLRFPPCLWVSAKILEYSINYFYVEITITSDICLFEGSKSLS